MDLVMAVLQKFNVVPVPLIDGQLRVIRSRAMLEANRAGVFHALAGKAEGLTPEDLAGQIGFKPESCRVLLPALASAGYLRSRNGRFVNGPWVRKWILDPRHSLHHVLLLQLHAFGRMTALGETLRNGRPSTDAHEEIVAQPSRRQEIYTLAMRELARLMLPGLIRRAKLPPKATRLFDIGGAHGEYSRALVRRYPQLHATVLDLEGPIDTARQILEREGNPEKLELRAGDCLSDDLGGDWDVVLLANLVHIFDADQNLGLLKRIRASLRPGGCLLAMDQFVGQGRLRDNSFAILSLNFFNIGGRSYTTAEMRAMLAEAGFRQVTVKPLGLFSPACLIQGWA